VQSDLGDSALLLCAAAPLVRRSTVPSNNLVVVGSSMVCGCCAMDAPLADRGGEEVRRCGEWIVVMLL
jgi:hypothetical protein